MEEEEKNFSFGKIFKEAITGSIIVVISSIILWCVYIIVSPNLEFKMHPTTTNKSEVDNALSKISEAMIRIYDDYIEEISYDDLVVGAISGMGLITGDPYTRYLSQEDFDEMLVEGKEEYVGIGVHLTYDTQKQGIQVLGVMPDSPALEAGIKAGDVIYYIDNQKITYENYYDMIDTLKSQEGTVVNLVILRNGSELKEFNIVRKRIQENNIESSVLDGNIGYIKIWQFENEIYNQFKKEYDNLKQKGIKGLVIDLRNNPGGFVSEALYIANLLVPEADALKLVSRYGTDKVYKTSSNTEIDIPLSVLVNSNSASSSEILASIIKDNNKGTIIGTKTYGKGIVQTTKKLSFGGALTITTAKYYTQSGIEIHKNGIEPDIEVNLPDEYKNDIVISKENDTQLQKAIEFINSKV